MLQPHPSESTNDQLGSRPVLVVEDDIDLLSMMELVLVGEGYRVATATNGSEALERIGEDMPGLILLDMKMPVMDGWEFAKEFHNRYDHSATIVVVTAARDAKIWAQEIGAEGYLAKPFDIDELIRTTEKYFPNDKPNLH